jgi:hypothetical protein
MIWRVLHRAGHSDAPLLPSPARRCGVAPPNDDGWERGIQRFSGSDAPCPSGHGHAALPRGEAAQAAGHLLVRTRQLTPQADGKG